MDGLSVPGWQEGLGTEMIRRDIGWISVESGRPVSDVALD